MKVCLRHRTVKVRRENGLRSGKPRIRWVCLECHQVFRRKSAAKKGPKSAPKAKYCERFPEKRVAHHAVEAAVKNGTMKREPCGKCGSLESHAHHEDYSKPLAVDWLCAQHHADRHIEMKCKNLGRNLAGGSP